MSDLRLITEPNKIHLFLRKEKVALYDYRNLPGFLSLALEGGREVTRREEADIPAIFSNLTVSEREKGGTTGTSTALQARVTDTMARRGTFSIGFRQSLEWRLREENKVIETRTARLGASPCEGAALDFETRLDLVQENLTQEDVFSEFQHRFVVRLAPSLFGETSRVLNSAGSSTREEIADLSAHWTSTIGVVGGETVGIALLEHPDNPGFPNRCSLTETGILSVISRFSLTKPVTLQYRLVTFMAYVEAGWIEARWQEYSRRPAGFAPH